MLKFAGGLQVPTPWATSIDVRADRAWEPAWARPLTWWGERAGECLLLSVPLEVERGLRHLAVQAGPGETLDALEPFVLGRTVRPVGAQSVPLPVLLVVVFDRPRSRVLGDRCVYGPWEADRQRFVRLDDRVAVQSDVDRLGRLARGEDLGSLRGGVVTAALRGPVRRCVSD